MGSLRNAINKKADLALLQMEQLHENLTMLQIDTHGSSEWISYWNNEPRSKKTALKRQIVELRQTLKVISDMLDR